MRNVTVAVSLGYFSIYLCVAPLLTSALILGICKCLADSTFRSWPLADKLVYSLIGTLVPCTVSRANSYDPENEDPSVDVDVKDTSKSRHSFRPTTAQDDNPDNNKSSPAEENEDVDEKETHEFDIKKRNGGRELSAIIYFHAASVVLGVATLAYMHHTSVDFQTSCSKVREASSIDLREAVYIGGPVSLLASIGFRLLHHRLGPWRLINKKPTCDLLCPPNIETAHERFEIKL